MDDLDDFLSDLGAFQGSSLGSQLDMRRQPTLGAAAAPAPKTTKPQRRQRDEDAAPAAKAAPKQSLDPVWECECCTLKNPASVATCKACENSRNAYMCGSCSKLVKPTKSGERNACRRCPAVPNVPPPPEAAAAAAPAPEPAVEAAAAFVPERAVGIVGSDTDSDFTPSTDEDEESDLSDSCDSDSDPGADTEDPIENVESRVERVGALMQSLAQRCAHDDLVPAPAPKTMATRGQLRPFQLQALRWMLDREDNKTSTVANPRALEMVGGGRCSGGILADFMGYGKTRTIIALCESTREKARIVSGAVVFGAVVRSRATLIVCPVSLIAHWCAEIKRVVDEPRRVLRFHGEGRKNVSLFDIAQEYDYVLTSFNTLAHEMRGINFRNRPTESAEEEEEKGKRDFRPSPLSMVEWFRVVLDEAHYARNARAQQSRAIGLLSAARRWVVTATPMSNSVNDLFPLMQFLKVPLFSENDWWITNVRKPVEAAAAASARTDGGTEAAVSAALPLQVILSVIMLRRTGESLDAVTKRPVVELPPKTTQLIHVRLTAPERAFYDELFEGGLLKLSLSREGNPGESRGDQHRRRFATALLLLMRCRQACCHVNFVIAALQKLRGTGGPSAADSTVSTSADGDTSLAIMTEQLARRNSELQARISDELRSRLQARHQKKKSSRNAGSDTSSFVDSTINRIVAAANGAPGASDATVTADATVDEEEANECVICMDAFTRPTMLPCAHMFCFECITTAMKQARACPCCKRPCVHDDLVDIDAVKARARESASSDAAGSQLDVIDTAVVGAMKDWGLGSKLTAAVNLMKEFPMEEKIIVFTQFSSYAEFIVQKLNQREEGDFHAVAFTGALTANRRAAVLKDFESAPIEAPLRPSTDFFGAGVAAAGSTERRPRHVVLVATVQTCGVGLNITCASRCIVMDPCWNPATEAQATNRCHRIGQTRPVFIYRMITENSIEVQIEKLASTKSAFADLCLSRAHRVQRMGLDDIVNVFDAALDAEDLDE